MKNLKWNINVQKLTQIILIGFLKMLCLFNDALNDFRVELDFIISNEIFI